MHIKNITCINPEGDIKFMAIIFFNPKCSLSDNAFTDSEFIFEDFFLCITSLGKIDAIAVAPPNIRYQYASK